jgi:hypothetical protein
MIKAGMAIFSFEAGGLDFSIHKEEGQNTAERQHDGRSASDTTLRLRRTNPAGEAG